MESDEDGGNETEQDENAYHSNESSTEDEWPSSSNDEIASESEGSEEAEDYKQIAQNSEKAAKGKGKRREVKKLQKRRPKKKRKVERSVTGAPMSLQTTTGSAKYVAVDYGKRLQTEAEKRNKVEVDGVKNIPDGFTWTDHPHFSKVDA